MEEIRNKAGPEHTGTSLYNATYDPGDANPPPSEVAVEDGEEVIGFAF